MLYIGIDPGKNGGIAVYSTEKDVITEAFKMPETPLAISLALKRIANENCCKIVLESVHAMPGQGVTSMFTFGQGFGWVQGVIATLGIPCVEVTPVKWMKLVGTMPKDKSERKHFIQDWVSKRLGKHVPLNISDAVAIACVAKGLWK